MIIIANIGFNIFAYRLCDYYRRFIDLKLWTAFFFFASLRTGSNSFAVYFFGSTFCYRVAIQCPKSRMAWRTRYMQIGLANSGVVIFTIRVKKRTHLNKYPLFLFSFLYTVFVLNFVSLSFPINRRRIG